MSLDLPPTAYEAIAGNRWRTLLLFTLFPVMLVLIVFLASVGYGVLIAGENPDAMFSVALESFVTVIPWVFLFGAVWVPLMVLSGSKMVLAFAGAKPVTKAEEPELYRLVENLAIRTGLPTPAVYVIEDESLNAFATGFRPEQAAVAVTRGILHKLSKPELEGVLAHEFGHILNRDTRVMLIAITMVGLIQLAADIVIRMVIRTGGVRHRGGSKKKGGGGFLLLIAFAVWLIGAICAVLVQMGISRRREYLADAESAYLTRNPVSLATALEKIGHDARVEVLDGKRTVAQLCIADPLEEKTSALDQLLGLFHTHPPLHARIKALREMGGQPSV